MPTIKYSNLQCLTIPTIRKITTREIRKLQFELMYPDLIRALKYTKQKVEEKSYNFIRDFLLVDLLRKSLLKIYPVYQCSD